MALTLLLSIYMWLTRISIPCTSDCSGKLEPMGGKPKLPERLELLELLSKLVKIISFQGSPYRHRKAKANLEGGRHLCPFLLKKFPG